MPDTFTANYNLIKPEVNASRDTWGEKLRQNMDTIDGVLKGLADNKIQYDPVAKTSTADVNFTGVAPKIAGNEIATKAFVNAAILAALPSGVIVKWKGTVATIPAGYALCDGLNGTPDLRNKFVMGAGTGVGITAPGAGGGAFSHTHNAGKTGSTILTPAQIPGHQHPTIDPGHKHGVIDPGHTHGYSAYSTFRPGVTAGTATWPGQETGLVTASAGTGVSIAIAATGVTVGFNVGGDGPHDHPIATADHTPPFYALAFIMKL